jgi:ATP-dependent RNA helicase DeaD
VSDDSPGFADLGLHPDLVAVLEGLGYEEPTPIQRAAIPPLLEGRDLLGQAATGTGKTAAFALPVVQRLGDGRADGGDPPRALVLVPTRELAMQVSQAVHTYGRGHGTRVLPIYGGQPIGRQLRELSRGVDVVVATPGRALDHLARGSLDLSAVEVVVLDEADEMLDMGFAEDIETVLEGVPDGVQRMLFSATMPARITGIADRHLRDPVRVEIAGGPAAGEQPAIREVAYVVARHHKAQALARILDVEAPEAAIVFCRTRTDVDELAEVMTGRGYRAEALHGGLGQEQRDRVMGRLRNGLAELLVATDVAARGLDVDVLTHVVNHTVPSSPETYVHRIGRVGRAGREGVAITLVAPREHRALQEIERHTGRRMEIGQIPTVADLRARRLGAMEADVREAAADPSLDTFRPVVEALAEELDPVQIALAALKLLHDEAHGDAEEERDLPAAELEGPGGGRGPRSRGDGDGGGGGGGRRAGQGGSRPGPRPPAADQARLWISLGRDAGVRPQDLVGAIAGETSLTGRDVGTIVISTRFSLVDVPAARVDEVVAALSRTTIRGRTPRVRRDARG